MATMPDVTASLPDAEQAAILADARANLPRLQALHRVLAASAGTDIAAYVEIADIDAGIRATERVLQAEAA